MYKDPIDITNGGSIEGLREFPGYSYTKTWKQIRNTLITWYPPICCVEDLSVLSQTIDKLPPSLTLVPTRSVFALCSFHKLRLIFGENQCLLSILKRMNKNVNWPCLLSAQQTYDKIITTEASTELCKSSPIYWDSDFVPSIHGPLGESNHFSYPWAISRRDASAPSALTLFIIYALSRIQERGKYVPPIQKRTLLLIFPAIVCDGLVKSDLTKDYDKRFPSKEVKLLVVMKFYAITFVEIKDS